MPRNVGLGGKNKKKGKKFGDVVRELAFKEDGQDYGQNVRLLGDCRLEILCTDGVKRDGHIRGTMRKKVFINMGDIVLVSIREFEPEKCDIILKYTEDEVRKLKKCGEIPEHFKIPEKEEQENEENDDDDPFKFIDDKDNKKNDDGKDIEKKKGGNYVDELDDLNDELGEDEEDEDDLEEEDKKDNEDEEEKEEEDDEEDDPYSIVDSKKKKGNNINIKTGKFSSDKHNKQNKQSGNDKKKEIDDL